MTLILFLAMLAQEWKRHPLPVVIASGETERKPLPATMGGGIAVFDFDGDGRLDLFFANGGELPSGGKKNQSHTNRLLRNIGGMKFEDVTERAGLAGTEFSFGAAAGDFDGDGKIDLVVTTLRGIHLYRNLGNGKFSDITADSKINNLNRWAIGAAWVDYNRDGKLDLFVVNYVQWVPEKEPECRTAGRVDFCHPRYYEPSPNALFRNNGDGTFTDVSKESGIEAHAGKGMGVAVADWNGDGHPDFFVTNDRVPAFLFLSQDKGKYVESAFEWGVAVPPDGTPVSGMGVDTQDIDGDGKPDLVYTALKDETFPLLRHTGKDFEDITATTRLAPLSRRYAGWGVMFTDLAGTGRNDIVVAASDALSGKVDASRKSSVIWFRNSGKNSFTVEELPVPRAMYRGLVVADINGDGCPEIIVSALDAPAQILSRKCPENFSGLSRQSLGSSAVGYSSSFVPLQSSAASSAP